MIHRTRGSSQLASYLVTLRLRTLKARKCQAVLAKLLVKHSSSAKTKDMKSYVIQTVEQKSDNIILHTGTNDLKTIDTPEEICMVILHLAMTYKMDTHRVFISGIVPRS